MKKLFFSICLLLANTAIFAQEPDTVLPYIQTFTQRFDSLAGGLIYSRVPTGVLYERVYPWSGIENWQPGDTLTPSRLRQAAWEMTQSRVKDTAAGWAAYKSWQDALYSHKMTGNVSVLGLNYSYSVLDSQAAKDGRIYLTADSLLVDKGTGAPPYVTQKVAWAALGIDASTELYAESALSISFPGNGLLNNTENTVTAIRIRNLATGQELLFPKGADAQLLQLPQAGSHLLELSLRYADGSYSPLIRQRLTVLTKLAKATGADCDPIHGLIESEKLYQGSGEPIATSTWADYHIYYHYTSPAATQCEQVLKKPVIILDGFDPQNSRQFFELYNIYLSVRGTSTNLAEELRKQGYDVVILNFPKLGQRIDVSGQQVPEQVKMPNGTRTNRRNRDGGTDFIQRNAYALEALIKQLNNTLQANGSTEPLVVVGPSMGGLISRYALDDMENNYQNNPGNTLTWNGSPHNCRLWVSFDSPHWGANIPLAVQANILAFTNFGNQDAATTWNQKIYTPAARQMLIEQMDGQNNMAPWRSAFINSIGTGFPQLCRRVGISNGSANGLDQPTPTAGDYSLSGKGFHSLGVMFVTELRNMPWRNVSRQICSARISKISYALGFIPSYSRLNYTLNKTNINPRGSMDVAQGGKNYVYDDVKKGFSDALASQGLDQGWYVNQRSHCFIPTISALAPKYPDWRDWHGMLSVCDFIRSEESYFENVKVATDTNEEHIAITPSTAAWMMGQLNVPYYRIMTTAPPVRCKEVTYYIQPVPPSNTSVIWSAPNNAPYTIVRSNYRSVTIKMFPETTAPSYIEAKIAYDQCEGEPIYARVRGSLAAPVSYPYDFSFVPASWISCNYKAQVNGVFPGDIYEWSMDGVNFTVGGPSFIPPGTNGFQVGPNANSKVWLRLATNSGCRLGPTYQIMHTFNYTSHPSGSPCGLQEQTYPVSTRFKVAPNPTTTDWDITVQEPTQQLLRWSLHNAQGQIISQSEAQNGSFPTAFRILGASLPSGFYYLQIQQDDVQELLKLSKQ